MVKKEYVIPLLASLIIIGLWLYGPIPQDETYHSFADERNALRIPNFLNVISNVPFVIIGIMGLQLISKKESKKIKMINGVLFTGFLLLTFGSSYYHLYPNNMTLVYDRIPIGIIIMSFFSLVIEDYLHPKRPLLLLTSLNIIAVLSVIYWALTEATGKGDLRWYAMVQFFPILAIPIILLLYKSVFEYRKEIVLIYLSFCLAKLAERYDQEIFIFLGKSISGHSFKHLLMAVAGYGIIRLVRRRSMGIY